MLKKSLLLAASLCSASAVAAPSAESVNAVVQHYYTGDTPVLFDVKLCAEIGKSGAEKNNCKTELDTTNLLEGTKAFVWMSYLVPKGVKPTILLQSNFKGMTREAKNIVVGESLRYRTWKNVTLNKVGSWELPILLETADGFTELNKLTVNVVAKPTGE